MPPCIDNTENRRNGQGRQTSRTRRPGNHLEQRVGGVHPLARDRSTGALGQLLTYAVGLDGGIAVWLATGFHDEHRAVLDRLNETADALRCFAVEMRLLRIGASAAAPLFSVVARPDGPGGGTAH